ncbi:uncharacterized protein [Onthophagus taurus]|uniref:uncharacterized protein n=1 Tax=Onthophagus taurus TaxID=166361 RepID=UPI0039BDB700
MKCFKNVLILALFCIALRLTEATQTELTPDCKDKIQNSCGQLSGLLIQVSLFGNAIIEIGGALVTTLITAIQSVLCTVITLVYELLDAALTAVVKVVVGLLKFVAQTLRCLIPNLEHLLGCLLTAVAKASSKVIETVTGLVNDLSKTINDVLGVVITDVVFVHNSCGGSGL